MYAWCGREGECKPDDILSAYIPGNGEIFHPCKVTITDNLCLLMNISTTCSSFLDILSYQNQLEMSTIFRND